MRDHTVTLPSPSELDAFTKCPTFWYFRYLLRVGKIESATRLESGKAVNDALNEYHLPTIHKPPLEVYDDVIMKARESNPSIPEEEWQKQCWMDRAALDYYIKNNVPVAPDWSEVVGVQIQLKEPALGVPDLLYRTVAGHLGILEWKVISGWADVEYENLKYEMSYQPIYYTWGVSNLYDEPVNEIEMRYLIRPKPASGRYKETPPDYYGHRFNVEHWKKEMWLCSAGWANRNMQALIVGDGSDREIPLVHIPKFTRNCKEIMGSKTFICDYYPACSMNMSPVGMAMFEVRQ